MTAAGESLAYRRLRAPREHAAALIDPPLAQAEALVRQKVELLKGYQHDCRGRTLRQLSSEARQHLLQAAHRYTSTYRDIEPAPAADDKKPILLTGHQPQLFHPGVWFKNFALSALGKKLSGRAINLLIDNDTLNSATLRVPSGTVKEPHVESVPVDRQADEIPFEQRQVLDRDLFESFGQRVQQVIAPLVPNALIGQLWPEAVEALKRTDNLGQCLAQARHRLEGQWGLSSWELPISEVYRSAPFRWFATHLLGDLPRFREIYNASLADYRRANRVRSRSHPVPDLAEEDGWIEAPFWLWTSDDARRRRLFARITSEGIELTDRGQFRESLSLSPDAGAAVEQLMKLEERGVKLRGRALITTMYSRLMLSDLFLHGIGGAKYDQLTDAIIAQFFDLTPPRFITLTATLHLPIDRQQPSADEFHELQQQLRELTYNPQRHAESNDSATQDVVTQLIQEKKQWLEMQLPRGQRLERHQQITRLNSQLKKYVSQKRRHLLDRRDELSTALRKEAILASREYSYCLFPEKTLRPLLLELSGGAT